MPFEERLCRTISKPWEDYSAVHSGYYLDDDDVELARQQGVFALLHYQLNQHAKTALLSPNAENRLKTLSQTTAAQELQVNPHRTAACSALSSIDPIILKGWVMAYGYYPQAYLRPMGDLDILINEQDARIARRQLEAIGYKLQNSNFGSMANSQFVMSKRISDHTMLNIDIHTRLFNRPALQSLLGHSQLKAEAVRLDISQANPLAPGPVHGLVHSCLHLLAHHYNSRKLIWLYDIKLIADRLDEKQQATLLRFSEEHRIAKMLHAALVSSNQAFSLNNNRLIEALSCQCKQQNGNDHPATSLLQTQNRLTMMFRDWQQLQNNRQRRQWIRQNLLPSKQFMKNHYQFRSNFLLGFFYVWRIVRGSVRLLFRK